MAPDGGTRHHCNQHQIQRAGTGDCVVEPGTAHDVVEKHLSSDDTVTETDEENDEVAEHVGSDTDSDETTSFDAVCEN